MQPNVVPFFDTDTNTASFVVIDPATRHCAIIDSVLDYDAAAARTDTASADAIIAYVQAEELTVDWVLETHVHADHLSAAPYLQEKLGGKIGIGENITVVQDTFGKVFTPEPSSSAMAASLISCSRKATSSRSAKLVPMSCTPPATHLPA